MAKKSPGISKPKRRGNNRLLFTLVLLPAAVVLLPTTIVICVGLLPTFVAYFTDRDREKFAAMTVGAINLCGTVPFVAELWENGPSLQRAGDIVSQPFTWLVMYTAAAIGWAVYLAVPSVVGNLLVIRAQTRIRALRDEQDGLAEEWGPEVRGEDQPA